MITNPNRPELTITVPLDVLISARNAALAKALDFKRPEQRKGPASARAVAAVEAKYLEEFVNIVAAAQREQEKS